MMPVFSCTGNGLVRIIRTDCSVGLVW